jgi:hypothetical protein
MLKPQDIVLALKLLCKEKENWSQGSLGLEMVLSASEVNAGIKRLAYAKLIEKQEDGRRWQVSKPALKQFMLHGIHYVFPAVKGAPTVGIPTAYAAEPLKSHSPNNDFPPVWPMKGGKHKGYTFHPLYPTVTQAIKNDMRLYEWLILVDALRDNDNDKEHRHIAELAFADKLAGRVISSKKNNKEEGKDDSQLDLLSL